MINKSPKLIPLSVEGISMKGLRPSQRLFIIELVKQWDATEAATIAGYSHPQVAAHKLMANPKIKSILERVQNKVAKRPDLEREKVLQRLSQAVFRNLKDLVNDKGDPITDLNELPDEAMAYIDGVEWDYKYDLEGNVIGKKIKYKLTSNASTLDMAMKHIGGYAATVEEKTLTIKWDQFTTPPEDADSVEKEIANIEYSIEKVEPSSNELEDEAFG